MSTGGSAGGVAATVTLDDAQIAAAVARLQAAMGAAGASMTKLKADFAAGTVSVDTFTEEVAQLNAEMGRLQASSQSFGTSIASAGQRSQAAARGITDFSRAAEDFSTGGFLGVMNNIPGILTNVGTALGVSATGLALFTAGASIVVALGYTLYKNWDSVTSLFQDKNPFPTVGDSIDKFTQQIKTNETELDKLRDKQRLTNDEYARAIELLEKNIQLEKEKKEAQRVEQASTEFLEAPSEETKAKGTAFEKAFAGMGAEVEAATTVAMEKDKKERAQKVQGEIDELNKLVQQGNFKAFKERQTKNKELTDIEAEDARENARKLEADVKGNKAGAYERFQEVMKQPQFTPAMREALGKVDPTNMEATEKLQNRAEMDRINAKRIETYEEEQYDIEADKFQREIEAPKAKRERRQAAEKADKQAKAKSEKQRREHEARTKAAVEEAETAVPGMPDVAEQAILQLRASGMSAKEAAQKVETDVGMQLIQGGMNSNQAEIASKHIAAEAGKTVQENAVKKGLGLRGGQRTEEPQRFSEVFAGSELMNRIQSGTSNVEEADRKKLISINDQMLNALAEQILPAIKNVGGIRPKVTR